MTYSHRRGMGQFAMPGPVTPPAPRNYAIPPLVGPGPAGALTRVNGAPGRPTTTPPKENAAVVAARQRAATAAIAAATRKNATTAAQAAAAQRQAQAAAALAEAFRKAAGPGAPATTGTVVRTPGGSVVIVPPRATAATGGIIAAGATSAGAVAVPTRQGRVVDAGPNPIAVLIAAMAARIRPSAPGQLVAQAIGDMLRGIDGYVPPWAAAFAHANPDARGWVASVFRGILPRSRGAMDRAARAVMTMRDQQQIALALSVLPTEILLAIRVCVSTSVGTVAIRPPAPQYTPSGAVATSAPVAQATKTLPPTATSTRPPTVDKGEPALDWVPAKPYEKLDTEVLDAVTPKDAPPAESLPPPEEKPPEPPPPPPVAIAPEGSIPAVGTPEAEILQVDTTTIERAAADGPVVTSQDVVVVADLAVKAGAPMWMWIGGGALVVGGLAWWMMSRKPVQANKRRRRRNRRR